MRLRTLGQPGLGVVPLARLLGEFADDQGRYASAKGHMNYTSTSPITKAAALKRRTGSSVSYRTRDLPSFRPRGSGDLILYQNDG